MIQPRDTIVTENKETLHALCDFFLTQIRKDVWNQTSDAENWFLHASESELKENAQQFIRRYEVILPDLDPKKIEKAVHPTSEGYDIHVKIPFTRTKSMSNAIFLSNPLNQLRKIDYVSFDPEFNDDYTGTNAPKYMEVHLTIAESGLEDFQKLLDDRMARVAEILESAREVIKDYNLSIETVFVEEVQRRKEKLLKSQNFIRGIKATDVNALTKSKKLAPKAIDSPKKSNKVFLTILLIFIAIQSLVFLYFLLDVKVF